VDNSRESQPVDLVDQLGVSIGVSTVKQAHTAPGQLHRAFSIMLFDSAGRMLLQQRAATKSRFADAWANTCCGHPAPGIDLVGAAVDRLRAELGIKVPELAERGTFVYQAADLATGRVEYEYDHVLVGMFDQSELDPNPAEVSRVEWVGPEILRTQFTENPARFAPWLPYVVRIATI
jgi:isopentenyl-diphosphate Delta-isomerase